MVLSRTSRFAPSHPINSEIGRRLRRRRMLLGLSQSALAGRLGETSRRVQAYEDGKIALPPDRLIRVAAVLGVPIGYFFTGLGAARRANLTEPSRTVATSGFRVAPQTGKLSGTILAAVERAVLNTLEGRGRERGTRETADESRADPEQPDRERSTTWIVKRRP